MTEKQKYWIASSIGYHALVEGADARDEWTKIRGWHEAAEPTNPDTQVHVVNGDLAGCIPLAAIGDWAALGWEPGPPPVPRDITKDPVLVDQPAVVPSVVVAVSPKSKAAAGGTNNEE